MNNNSYSETLYRDNTFLVVVSVLLAHRWSGERDGCSRDCGWSTFGDPYAYTRWSMHVSQHIAEALRGDARALSEIIHLPEADERDDSGTVGETYNVTVVLRSGRTRVFCLEADDYESACMEVEDILRGEDITTSDIASMKSVVVS